MKKGCDQFVRALRKSVISIQSTCKINKKQRLVLVAIKLKQKFNSANRKMHPRLTKFTMFWNN